MLNNPLPSAFLQYLEISEHFQLVTPISFQQVGNRLKLHCFAFGKTDFIGNLQSLQSPFPRNSFLHSEGPKSAANYARNVFLSNSFCPFASPGTDKKFASDVKNAGWLPSD